MSSVWVEVARGLVKGRGSGPIASYVVATFDHTWTASYLLANLYADQPNFYQLESIVASAQEDMHAKRETATQTLCECETVTYNENQEHMSR